jgi:S-sulfo-L-cysteine synthase (3-phospho-L-serine-dependent)
VKTLLVVKTGWRLAQRLAAFRTFAARGWRVAVADGVLNQSLRVADVPVVCDPAATARAAAAVRARVGRPDGILTFSDSALLATARLARALGLPFLSPRVAGAAVDKREQRLACARAGLPVPEWRDADGPDAAAAAVGEWGRAVVKPANRAAGVAVRLARTEAEARRAWREAADALRPGGRVLVERWLEGPEVSVESIAVGGRQRAVCVTDKVTTAGPHFVEVGHAVPSALAGGERDAVERVALAACDAIGLSWGACHTELKLTADGPAIVEVNARMAGDCIPDLAALALGVDLYELLGRQALGEELTPEDLLPTRDSGAAIHFALGSPGVLEGATSPMEAGPPPWLVELSVTSPPGHPLEAPRSNGDRIGYAIATAATSPEAAARARDAIESLDVALAPLD